jgi:hypothetical protein
MERMIVAQRAVEVDPVECLERHFSVDGNDSNSVGLARSRGIR